MSGAPYVFAHAEQISERERLQAIERIFDPATRARLTSLGVGPGWRCLEVGAGAGSIARWLAERVAPGGRVLAIDRDTRFLRETARHSSVRSTRATCARLPFPRRPSTWCTPATC